MIPPPGSTVRRFTSRGDQNYGCLFVAGSFLFIWFSIRLLGGGLGWRRLLPTAVFTTIGLLGLGGFSLIFFSSSIVSNDTSYGSIGVVFVILSWLIGVGVVVMGGAVMGAWYEAAGLSFTRGVRRLSDRGGNRGGKQSPARGDAVGADAAGSDPAGAGGTEVVRRVGEDDDGPMTSESRATDANRGAVEAAGEHPPMHDTQDFVDADRGFVATSAQRPIRAEDGRVVWDLDAYAFLAGPAPDTASSSLWRQGQLCAKDGLYEVVPGIYQVRGFDLSNVTFVEGDEGVIVVDPLTCRETASAAFALYRQHRGDRPVQAMIYTHSHIDHFGGVKGIIRQEDVDAGRVPVIAPEGFMAYAVAENVFAGTAMARRAGYMYGAALAKGPDGQIGTGLGQTTPTGETTLIPPTVEITTTGQELTIDGVRIVFQVTPGTEAPAEMNFYFPDHRALCAAENASHTLHNILTIRGAVVRDAHAWAHYLTETIDLWGDELDVVFASHHWPTWDRARAVEFLAMQRDMYLYLHDQTLRLINQGYVGAEIAEQLQMPPALETAWHTHGYYGSVSHNVKAIYQRYLGWYDGNPAHLWPHPPEEVARRYVTAMGGADAAVETAQRAYDEGDYRWVVELLDHVLFADQTHTQARVLQADAFERLGFGSENGTWRNAFLAAATELRHGQFGTPSTAASADLIGALTAPQVFDTIAVRIDGPQAWNEHLILSWVITDAGATYVTELRNGTLNHRTVNTPAAGTTTFTLTRTALIGLVTTTLDLEAAIADRTVTVDGDPADLHRLVGLLAPVDPDFAIVTP